MKIEDVLRNEFIPAITGGHFCSDEERDLLALPVKLGGFGIENVCHRVSHEFESSLKVTKPLVSDIEAQNVASNTDQELEKRLRNEIRNSRKDRHLNNHQNLITRMSRKEKRQNDIVVDAASNWLTSLPLKNFNFNLNKREFWDAIRLRYDWPIPNLPSKCACGNCFSVQHAMPCKKGGFVIQRHNELRDVTAKLLSEVCVDVEVEPPLIKLTGEDLVKSQHEVKIKQG